MALPLVMQHGDGKQHKKTLVKVDKCANLGGTGIKAQTGRTLIQRQTRHCTAGVVLCRPVESLGQVRRPLEHDLLRQLLGVAGVARHQLGQAAESVIYTRLLQG